MLGFIELFRFFKLGEKISFLEIFQPAPNNQMGAEMKDAVAPLVKPRPKFKTGNKILNRHNDSDKADSCQMSGQTEYFERPN